MSSNNFFTTYHKYDEIECKQKGPFENNWMSLPIKPNGYVYSEN